jgi:hypothetical protein
VTDNERLRHIEGKLDGLISDLNKWRTEVIVDVDRLKQSEASRIWWMRAIATAAVAALGTSIKSLFFR